MSKLLCNVLKFRAFVTNAPPGCPPGMGNTNQNGK